jgi:hypothetical protein
MASGGYLHKGRGWLLGESLSLLVFVNGSRSLLTGSKNKGRYAYKSIVYDDRPLYSFALGASPASADKGLLIGLEPGRDFS